MKSNSDDPVGQDVDPIEEIRAIREGIARKFKSAKAYVAYLQSLSQPPAKSTLRPAGRSTAVHKSKPAKKNRQKVNAM